MIKHTKPDNARLDRVVLEARKACELREAGYRERALRLFPWICGRCGREFSGTRLRELTVHHKDHNHDNNPLDGSNWELLCVYCHDNEHSRVGDHSTLFDTRLVSLVKIDSTKIEFDGELVMMLDEYVFPNRPTKSNASMRVKGVLQAKKLETRGRFESLSVAQRKVFWLVVGGKTTREIGQMLNVSVNTIKTHRAAIFNKMEVKTALELVKKADVLR